MDCASANAAGKIQRLRRRRIVFAMCCLALKVSNTSATPAHRARAGHHAPVLPAARIVAAVCRLFRMRLVGTSLCKLTHVSL